MPDFTVNGKTYRITPFEDDFIRLKYTPGDESRQVGDIHLTKPTLRNKNLPPRYEITVFDKVKHNHVILARVEEIPDAS